MTNFWDCLSSPHASVPAYNRELLYPSLLRERTHRMVLICVGKGTDKQAAKLFCDLKEGCALFPALTEDLTNQNLIRILAGTSFHWPCSSQWTVDPFFSPFSPSAPTFIARSSVQCYGVLTSAMGGILQRSHCETHVTAQAQIFKGFYACFPTVAKTFLKKYE